MAPLKGSCLCGNVTFTIPDRAPVEEEGTEICHCTDCRQATGSIAGYFITAKKGNWEMTGELSSFERTAESGAKLTRHRCKNCGSPVYDASSMRDGSQVTVYAGLFPPGEVPKPSVEIWLRSSEPWHKTFPGALTLQKQEYDG